SHSLLPPRSSKLAITCRPRFQPSRLTPRSLRCGHELRTFSEGAASRRTFTWLLPSFPAQFNRRPICLPVSTRFEDVTQHVGLRLFPHQVRILLSPVVVNAEGLVIIRILDQKFQTLGGALPGFQSISQYIGRELLPVDGNHLHAGTDTSLGSGHSLDGVNDSAVRFECHTNRIFGI